MFIYKGIEDEEEDAQHNEPSSSCSSPGTNYHGLECSIEVSNEFSMIDGEIDRSFDQMVPIPVSTHYPNLMACCRKFLNKHFIFLDL